MDGAVPDERLPDEKECYGLLSGSPGLFRSNRAPTEDYSCFLTNFGSLLQTAMLGFTGIRVTHPGWAKYPATLPEGWEKLEIDRVWVRGKAKRLVAVNGKLAQFQD